MFEYRWKLLPPAEGTQSPVSVARSVFPVHKVNDTDGSSRFSVISAAVAENLTKNFNCRSLILVGSGTEALFHIFLVARQITKKDIVVISAYTCPDIATAAVQAGCRLYLLDVEDQTLDLNFTSFPVATANEVCAVVLSNLYGLVDNLENWNDLAEKNNFIVIDDACQAANSIDKGNFVGCRPGKNVLGVLSFGRGKAISGIGGGAILLSEGSSASLAAEVFNSVTLSRESHYIVDNVLNLGGYFYGFVLWLFSHPSVYRLPASLPFLRLGETVCHESFPLRNISSSQLRYSLAALNNRDKLIESFSNKQQILNQSFSSLSDICPSMKRQINTSVLIRYPLICLSSEQRNNLLLELNRQGLGASSSYPCVISDYRPLASHIVSPLCSIAKSLATRIITLPIHTRVKEDDLKNMARIVLTFFNEHPR